MSPPHLHAAPGDERRLAGAAALVAAFMAGEIVVGLVSHSLALLSDAAHMLTDAAALGMALVAMRLARRPPSANLTYGLQRAEILSALANGVTLGVLAAWLLVEAARRLADPPVVSARPVLAVAVCGIAVNAGATALVAGAQRRSLNIEGGLRHLLTDMYAFMGTAAAAVVILATGYQRADAAASLLVVALMVRACVSLVGSAGRALLEAAPAGVDTEAVGTALAAHPHVVNIHDLHVWEITTGFPALSAHVIVHEGDDCHSIRVQLEGLLAERFGIDHTTLQVDHDAAGVVRWAPPPPRGAGSPQR